MQKAERRDIFREASLCEFTHEWAACIGRLSGKHDAHDFAVLHNPVYRVVPVRGRSQCLFTNLNLIADSVLSVPGSPIAANLRVKSARNYGEPIYTKAALRQLAREFCNKGMGARGLARSAQ